MALTSPGVEVQVIDESFYAPAEPGSVPLIVLASAENKLNGAGTEIAAGTLASNAGKVFRISSQRELVETFGVPFFEKTASNSPIHGSERNEYGLLTAYSILGVTNSAFVMRANIDLNELIPSTEEPVAGPVPNTWWVNTYTTSWGVQEWNSNLSSTAGGQKFVAKFPIVLTDDDTAKVAGAVPRESVGIPGDYAVVFKTVHGTGEFVANDEFARLYYKSPGNLAAGIEIGQWVLVGSNDWAASWPCAYSRTSIRSLNAGDEFTINGTSIVIPDGETVAVRLTRLVTAINAANIVGVTAAEERSRIKLFSNGATEAASDSTKSGAIILANVSGTPLADLAILDSGKLSGVFLAPKIEHAPHTQRPLFKRTEQPGTELGFPSGSLWIKTTEANQGARLRVSKYNGDTDSWVPYEAPMYASNQDAMYNLDRAGGGMNILVDTLYTQFNATENYSYRAPDNSFDSAAGGGYDASLETAEFRIWRRRVKGATVIESKIVDTGTFAPGTRSFLLAQSMVGARGLTKLAYIVFDATGSAADADLLAAAINSATYYDANSNLVVNQVEASVTNDNRVVIMHKAGGDIRFKDGINGVIGTIFTPFDISKQTGTANFYSLDNVTGVDEEFLASNWTPLASSLDPKYYASPDQPTLGSSNGQLWYNPTFTEVDIMVHNGNTWVGYRNQFGGFPNTDPNGPQVQATAPTTQSDGTPLVTNDLWISTADLENFPTIYRWDSDVNEWTLVDKTDQTTEEGVVFADARYNIDGLTPRPSSINELLESNFLDPDAPDPALYPKGILLYNTRRSYGNVKMFVRNSINVMTDNPRYKSSEADSGLAWISGEAMINYYPHRWVTASSNNEDGSGSFGRKAQRKVVVERLKSTIDTSEEARDEERRNFNLIACPGYPEVLSNLVNLNLDRKVTAFVVGDTPLRLRADTTSLVNWGTNEKLAFDNGDDGIVTYDEYSAVWYPNGYTNDLSGASVVVPASHMMLKTIIVNDQMAYPWFAPAGTRRGGITNATSVGYIDAETGEFVTVALNTGQRDTLYDMKINPIPFFVGVGLVAYGQKTRARNVSSLDRINVARLVVYLRSQLAKLARPYIFEPNDKTTRDEFKGAVESLLLELVALRAIDDFAVVCDETNNTPARIDRNELYCDVALVPLKAIEFIMIPLRLKNTGEI